MSGVEKKAQNPVMSLAVMFFFGPDNGVWIGGVRNGCFPDSENDLSEDRSP